MVFSSYIFLFVFLPLTLLLYYGFAKYVNHRSALASLIFSSLIFYGWWDYRFIALIIYSIIFNHFVGGLLSDKKFGSKSQTILLVFGVAVNLIVIGFFKYADFFIATTNSLSGTSYNLLHIILPLAISFFTFQQITYLVDSHRGLVSDRNFLNYCLFVVFFPQLIAGPIVHHGEILQQFTRKTTFQFNPDRFSLGLTVFVIGLFKKVVIADRIAAYSTPVFNAALLDGTSFSFFEAWGGALSYTFQLYFDFSGYSDMALGLGLMFGIKLPFNFNSPYKAENIIDFWQRWHMTLSRFLRGYLYIPLGGNRHGEARRYSNLFIVMLLGGLWHGAAWTFVLWGGIHAVYLAVNHLWRRYFSTRKSIYLGSWISRLITFFFVSIAWVFFRAESLEAAVKILSGMFGLNGICLPAEQLAIMGPVGDVLSQFVTVASAPYFSLTSSIWIMLAFVIVWVMPNTKELIEFETHLSVIKIRWLANLPWAAGVGVMAALSVGLISASTEFLYFQF